MKNDPSKENMYLTIQVDLQLVLSSKFHTTNPEV